MAKKAKKKSNKSKSSEKKKKSKPKSKPKAKPDVAPKTAPVEAAKPKEEMYSSLLEQIGSPKSKFVVVGMWALIISVLFAIMISLVEAPVMIFVLVAVGFIVGFLNFEHEETTKFLVATMSLLVLSSALLLTGFSRLEIVAPVVALFLERAAYNVIAVIAPALLVVSMKALKELAE